MFSTPSCVSFSCIIRDNSNGPIWLTVTRIGCPCSPKTSKKWTGQLWKSGFSIPNSGIRFSMNPLILPTWEIPESPFISAMKQGTPAWQKVSAITWSVTVLPVPVAPAISPWRFAILPVIESAPLAQWAMYSPRSLSYIVFSCLEFRFLSAKIEKIFVIMLTFIEKNKKVFL